MDLTFSNRSGPRRLASIGLSSQLGAMDYGLMYRLVGYRTAVFDVPTSVELGYRALRINADNGRLEANTTLNGPFAGFTAYS